ncbi:hypothetical protein FB451DRAFT_1246049 [Mycena latifolia]|nr:hypothetical protein FB451DRAFT_1246049 [Mycena latifolia]
MKLETHSDEDLPLAPPTKAENDNEVFDALQALSLDSHTAGNIYPVKTSSEFYPDAMNLKKEDQDHSMLSITDHDIFGWKYSESVLSKPWLFPAVSKGYSHATAVRKKLPSAAEDFKEKRPIKSSRAPYTIERCVQCRRRKLKCDGVKPECETCRRTSNEVSFCISYTKDLHQIALQCSWVSIGGNIKKELTEDENAVSGPSGTSATGNKPEDGKVTNPEKISACVPCRQRNIKCDGVQPECGACQRRKSKECSWVSVGGRRKNEVADNEDAGSEPSLSGATRGSEPPTYSGDENLTSDNASSAASTSKKPLIHTVGSEAVTRASHLRRKAEGKYICDICGKTFTAKHNLRNHHNAHNGVKEFSCDVCHKHFSTMHTMKRHRKRCALITSNKLAT